MPLIPGVPDPLPLSCSTFPLLSSSPSPPRLILASYPHIIRLSPTSAGFLSSASAYPLVLASYAPILLGLLDPPPPSLPNLCSARGRSLLPATAAGPIASSRKLAEGGPAALAQQELGFAPLPRPGPRRRPLGLEMRRRARPGVGDPAVWQRGKHVGDGKKAYVATAGFASLS